MNSASDTAMTPRHTVSVASVDAAASATTTSGTANALPRYMRSRARRRVRSREPSGSATLGSIVYQIVPVTHSAVAVVPVIAPHATDCTYRRAPRRGTRAAGTSASCDTMA